MEKVWEKIRLTEEISDLQLREKVKRCFEEAILRGGWSEDEVDEIPFTLLIPDCPVSLLEHTVAVTEIAIKSAETVKSMYPEFEYNRDILIAGAILHDVGKFLEYARSDDGKIVKSFFGKILRHPFSGAALAYEMRLPDEVVHIIAVHAHEGDNGYRTPEAIIINKADFITFETLREFLK
ncbi:HDIG domain-containing protein [bacterium]|nr:HDIG domain-containing protein [bacterium]